MTTWARWLRFNLVGILGMGVQLATLYLLNRAWHGHYLLATAAALELTLLHNFVWHWSFTWRERRAALRAWNALLRFHATNGLTSLAGNLLLVALLVRGAGVPLVAANAVAIAVCSLLNFLLAQRWAFSSHETGHAGTSVDDSAFRMLPITMRYFRCQRRMKGV